MKFDCNEVIVQKQVIQNLLVMSLCDPQLWPQWFYLTDHSHPLFPSSGYRKEQSSVFRENTGLFYWHPVCKVAKHHISSPEEETAAFWRLVAAYHFLHTICCYSLKRNTLIWRITEKQPPNLRKEHSFQSQIKETSDFPNFQIFPIIAFSVWPSRWMYPDTKNSLVPTLKANSLTPSKTS